MADTWFRGRLNEYDCIGLAANFDKWWPGLVDCTITNSNGERYLWFNLTTPSHAGESQYMGWVNINLSTGDIEFGEPAA